MLKLIALKDHLAPRHRIRAGTLLDAAEFDDPELTALVRDHVLDVVDIEEAKGTG